MADTYVPMISSGVAGPLGILHLPRLWLKVSLESQGKLASGYPGIGRGFDAMTCAALGLEEQAVETSASTTALTRTYAGWSLPKCLPHKQKKHFVRRPRLSRLAQRRSRNITLFRRKFLHRNKRRFFPGNGCWLGTKVRFQRRV